jgi:hypothetical protein
VFSETHIQPVAFLFNRTGARRGFVSYKHRVQIQDVVVLNEDAASTLPAARKTHYAGVMRSSADASTNGSPDRLATVVEAAEILGITPDAVRSRLRRGTLKRSPERGEEGEVLVVMPAPKNTDQSGDKSETDSDQSTDQSGDQSSTGRDASPTVPLVEEMREEVAFLREELRREREARVEEKRRHDTIVLQLAQRIPELEPSSEPRDTHEMASEEPGRSRTPSEEKKPSQRRSWWRAFFGLE